MLEVLDGDMIVEAMFVPQIWELCACCSYSGHPVSTPGTQSRADTLPRAPGLHLEVL